MTTQSKAAQRRMGVYSSDQTPQITIETDDTNILSRLGQCSIIAAVNGINTFEAALAAPTKAIYLLTGNPLALPEMIQKCRDNGKICLVNIDFLDGLSRDHYAVEFLAAQKVDGIVSTRFDTLKAAQKFGLATIQRTFAIDSAAMSAALKSMRQFVPDMLEVLPAMAAPKSAKKLRADHPNLKIIGGGLIETIREIEDLLAAGINSVTSSRPHLWLV